MIRELDNHRKYMRIFLVCNNLGGGGAERVHVNLASGFAQCGYEVFLIADLNQKASYPVDERVKILPLCPSTSKTLVKWSKAIVWMRRYVKKYKPDVVLGNMHLCSLVSKIACMGTGVPVILSIHNSLKSHPSYNPGRLTRICDEYLSRIYTRTTVLTYADYQTMKRKKNVIVMPNPLTFKPVAVVESGFVDHHGCIIDKKPAVLAAGRLDAWHYKGFDLLIRAWGIVSKSIEDEIVNHGWRLQIAGAGSKKSLEFLKGIVKESGVEDSIDFLGYRTDMEHLYREASIYCLSSRCEGLPMVLIEAMSQGCAPVACENLGRTREIITNETEGLLFKTADADDLARQLARMISDDEMRKSIQFAAFKRSKYYLPDNVLSMWETLLTSLK